MNDLYQDSQEHLYDELLLIDLLVRAQVLKHREATKNENSSFHGLYISEEEIDKLLEGDTQYNQWIDKEGEHGTAYEKIQNSIKRLSALIRAKINHSQKAGVELRLTRIAQLFNLDSFEADVLMISLAPEFDKKYRKYFSYLHDDVTRKLPSGDLILNILCPSFKEKNEHRKSFSVQAPLLKYNLLRYIEEPGDPDKPTIYKGLKIDNRIVGYLLGDGFLDDNLSYFTKLLPASTPLADLALPQEIYQRLAYFVRTFSDHSLRDTFIFVFHGINASHKLDTAAAVCFDLKLPLLVMDIGALYKSSLMFEQGIDLLLRESRLMNAAIFIDNCDFIFSEQEESGYIRRYLLNELDKYSLLSFINCEELPAIQGEFPNQKIISIELPIPEYTQRFTLWNQHLEGVKLEELDIKEIAGKYNLTSGQIKNIIASAQVFAFWRDPEEQRVTKHDLEDACHLHSNQKLKQLAQRITPKHRWDDIILKDSIKQKLQQLVNMFRYKHIVYTEWGFDKKLSLGKGISALFHGEPGTGKTLAAEIIAYELGMDLYKIDISTVVSKYIGETEKNLYKIFKEAENSNAILFFDEADSIFGKRTEVKDSHDRYSNTEVSYLLQRIDEFSGAVIMATNFTKNIDEAFERRLHFSIHFASPDEEARLQIWNNIFPKKSPLADDVTFDLLAKKLDISGGNIKNIALQAAFYAVDEKDSEDKKIYMRHVERACQNEYEKIGRLWNPLVEQKKG